MGRDYFGVFPLRGKVLNVREASHKVVTQNAEIQALLKIVGLTPNKEYDSLAQLRYGSIMIMTDQDLDGSHIKGILISWDQDLEFGWVAYQGYFEKKKKIFEIFFDWIKGQRISTEQVWDPFSFKKMKKSSI